MKGKQNTVTRTVVGKYVFCFLFFILTSCYLHSLLLLLLLTNQRFRNVFIYIQIYQHSISINPYLLFFQSIKKLI